MQAGITAVSNYLDKLMGGNNNPVPGAVERTPAGLGAKFLTYSKDLGAGSAQPGDMARIQAVREGLRPGYQEPRSLPEPQTPSRIDLINQVARQQQGQRQYANSFLMGGVPQVPPARSPGSQATAEWGARTRANIARGEEMRGVAAGQQNVPVSSQFLQGAYGRGYQGPSDRSLGRPVKPQGNSAVPKSPYKNPLGDKQ
jgi:hypothetical protein